MITVNTHEAKTQLSKLLKQVAEKHEVVRICRNGEALAELVACGRDRPAKRPLKEFVDLKGAVFHESLTAPIPDDFHPEYNEHERLK